MYVCMYVSMYICELLPEFRMLITKLGMGNQRVTGMIVGYLVTKYDLVTNIYICSRLNKL